MVKRIRQNRKYNENVNSILKQKRAECIVCNSSPVKDAIVQGIRGIDCPFCGYYEVGGDLKGRKEIFRIRSQSYYNMAIQHLHKRAPLVRKILKKYSATVVKQNDILQILLDGYKNILSEEQKVYNKSQYRKRLTIDPYQLKRLLTILLNNKAGIATIHDAEKDSCLKIIDSAIRIWVASEKYNKYNYDQVKKESILKLKKYPKSLKAYTFLIKDLVVSLNPLLRVKTDKYAPRSRKKENTFRLVSELLNCVFPHLRFTPERVKARFHK